MSFEKKFKVPHWLNEKFFEKSFSNGLAASKILHLKVEPVTAQGEHFGSLMLRVAVTTELTTINCIVKCVHEDEGASTRLTKYDVYNKEMEMYQKVLPDIRDLLSHFGNKTNISAATIFACNETKAMVFEDLSVRGYMMAARLNGFDMPHVKLVLLALAKFHASTAVLNERNDKYFENFSYGMFNRESMAFKDYFLTNIEALYRCVSKWQDFGYYAQKIKKLRTKLIENGCKAFDVKQDQFNCLNHGDIWINNAMFTYTTFGEPDHVMLLDFQFCCWTSPTLDLHHLFNTSLCEDLRRNDQDNLLQFYYEALSQTLLSLQFQGVIPTLHEFRCQYFSSSFYAFISGCLVQPIMINDVSDDANVHTLHGCDERARKFKDMIYANKNVQENLRYLLPMFDQMGHLD